MKMSGRKVVDPIAHVNSVLGDCDTSDEALAINGRDFLLQCDCDFFPVSAIIFSNCFLSRSLISRLIVLFNHPRRCFVNVVMPFSPNPINLVKIIFKNKKNQFVFFVFLFLFYFIFFV